jgi:KUP system potassium uptake protein
MCSERGGIEGLEVATQAATPFVVPLTLAVLALLFLFQHRGTMNIGKTFGPIMLLWFGAIAALGLIQIIQQPRVLLAVNPAYAYDFFSANRSHGLLVLGSVVLCFTGGEALYAYLGHFGRWPIRISWFGIACPALLLNYFGQGALLLDHPEFNVNLLWHRASPLLYDGWSLHPGNGHRFEALISGVCL